MAYLVMAAPWVPDEAAVQIHEFLQVMSASLLARYDGRIERYYAKKARPNVEELEPWNYSDEPF